MSFKCGGRCGNPACTYEGATMSHVNGHVGSVKAAAGRAKRAAKLASAATPAAAASTGTAPPSTGLGGGFYPSLSTWKAEQTTTQPGGGSPAPPTQGGSSPPGPTPPAVFDSTALWEGFAALVNELVIEPAHGAMRVEMTKAKAIALDASMKQMGLVVQTRPGTPIVMPWYAPFLLTFGGTFGIPLLVTLAPLLRKKMGEWWESRSRGQHQPIPPQVRIAPQPPVTPPVPAPLSESEAEEPRRVIAPVGPPMPPGMVYRPPREAE